MFQILSNDDMQSDIKKLKRNFDIISLKFRTLDRPDVLIPEPDIVHGNKCYKKYTVNNFYKDVKDKYNVVLTYKSFLKLFPEYNLLYTSKQGRSTVYIYTIFQVKNIAEDLADLIKFKLIRTNRL